MMESIAEVDEVIMEKYLESDDGSTLTTTDLIAGIRRACLKGDMVPTVCGASLRGKGVEPLLDSLTAFLPSPLDRPSSIAINHKTNEKKVISPDGKGNNPSFLSHFCMIHSISSTIIHRLFLIISFLSSLLYSFC